MNILQAPPTEGTLTLAEQRFLLRGVDWHAYRNIADALAGRHVRITYDRGNLELMTISSAHGRFSRLLGRFIVVLTEEFHLPVSSCGDMTCDLEEVDRGLEPDECYYITHEPQVRDKERIDLAVDPPPDLAAEIDISRSSRNRMDIYAALRVPEVWCFDGTVIRVFHLGAASGYVEARESQFFPGIPIHELADWLLRRTEMDENTLVRAFRDWVRQKLAERNGGEEK